MLLRRESASAIAVMERLVGMQAQVPTDPYTGLWSRIEGFDPAELSSDIEARRAVRVVMLLRTTIHLVSARDCLEIRPLLQPVAERQWRYSPFAKALRRARHRRGRGRQPRAAGGASADGRRDRETPRRALAGSGPVVAGVRDALARAARAGPAARVVGPGRAAGARDRRALARRAPRRSPVTRRSRGALPRRLRAGDGSGRRRLVVAHRHPGRPRPVAAAAADVPRRGRSRALRRARRPTAGPRDAGAGSAAARVRQPAALARRPQSHG